MNYSRKLVDDFLKVPESILTQYTERMKTQGEAESTSSGNGATQSQTASGATSPNNDGQRIDADTTSKGDSSRHWMTAFYIIVACLAVYSIYQKYKANSKIKPPLRNSDGTFNTESLMMSPTVITCKEVLMWVGIFLGVAAILWGWNKVMKQVKDLEKNTFA